MYELCPRTRRVVVVIGKLSAGGLFGEDCALGYSTRQYRAVATEDDTVVYDVHWPTAAKFISADDVASIRVSSARNLFVLCAQLLADRRVSAA
jgi:hypothetical protein